MVSIWVRVAVQTHAPRRGYTSPLKEPVWALYMAAAAAKFLREGKPGERVMKIPEIWKNLEIILPCEFSVIWLA